MKDILPYSVLVFVVIVFVVAVINEILNHGDNTAGWS